MQMVEKISLQPHVQLHEKIDVPNPVHHRIEGFSMTSIVHTVTCMHGDLALMNQASSFRCAPAVPVLNAIAGPYAHIPRTGRESRIPQQAINDPRQEPNPGLYPSILPL